MDFMDKLSKRIVELREAAGETQQELADAIGITRQSLSRYEIAARTVNVDVLGALAQHFHVSTDYLLGLSDVKSMEQDMQIACKVTGLSEKTINKIQDTVSDFKTELSKFRKPNKSSTWKHESELNKHNLYFSDICSDASFWWLTENDVIFKITENLRDLIFYIIFEIAEIKNNDNDCRDCEDLINSSNDIRLCLLDIYDISKSYAEELLEKVLYIEELSSDVSFDDIF